MNINGQISSPQKINAKMSHPQNLKGNIYVRHYGPNSISYTVLDDKPSIEGHILEGDSSLESIGIVEATNKDILDLFK